MLRRQVGKKESSVFTKGKMSNTKVKCRAFNVRVAAVVGDALGVNQPSCWVVRLGCEVAVCCQW